MRTEGPAVITGGMTLLFRSRRQAVLHLTRFGTVTVACYLNLFGTSFVVSNLKYPTNLDCPVLVSEDRLVASLASVARQLNMYDLPLPQK